MLGQSGAGRNGSEEVLRIPQSSSITGTSSSDCLVSYLGHSLRVGVLSYAAGQACKRVKYLEHVLPEKHWQK